MAQVILFEDAYYHGEHKHVFVAEPNFRQDFNQQVSSLVVLNGNWAFYVDPNFQTPNPPIFGPGLYPDLSLYPNLPAGIKNMSSLQPVDAEPTVSPMFLLTAMLYCSNTPIIMATISTYFFKITT
jgi:hypothetical protein